MKTARQQLLREIISELQTSEDVHNYLRDLFKDTLQEMLEVELETSLGYEKRERKISQQKISVMAIHQKM